MTVGPVAADDDGPTREPSVSWSVDVPCVDDAGDRACHLAALDDQAFVLSGSGPAGAAVLTAYDLQSGRLGWTVPAGVGGSLTVEFGSVVIATKSDLTVYDAESGALRWTHSGQLTWVNFYDVMFLLDGATTFVVDLATGRDLWSTDDTMARVCRDFVVTSTVGESDTVLFRVLDHLTGDLRWRHTANDTPVSFVTCSGGWVYTTDGQYLNEYESADGWPTWEAPIDGAGQVEVFREAAIVQTGSDGTTVAIDRRDGEPLWESTLDELGEPWSVAGRLRENADGLFTFDPISGNIASRVASPPDPTSPSTIAGISDTRVVVGNGSFVTTYGLNDLGVAWQIDLGAVPDGLAVSAERLAVLTGATLSVYADSPSPV